MVLTRNKIALEKFNQIDKRYKITSIDVTTKYNEKFKLTPQKIDDIHITNNL